MRESLEIEFTLDDLVVRKFGVVSTWILKTRMIMFVS
jgi:hypothetical protein